MYHLSMYFCWEIACCEIDIGYEVLQHVHTSTGVSKFELSPRNYDTVMTPSLNGCGRKDRTVILEHFTYSLLNQLC